MTDQPQSVDEDLAFMRALASESENRSESRTFGITYASAGIIYGAQCLISYALMSEIIPASSILWMAVGILPTMLFLIILFSTVWKDRSASFGVSSSNRAVTAAFAGAGLANIVLGLVFGSVAFAQKNWTIWLLFPAVVCAFQGGVWFTSAIIRRKLWYGLTALGWFGACFVLAMLVQNTNLYLMSLGVSLILLMALPGWLIVRQSKRE